MFSLSCLSVVAAMGEKQVVGYIALFLHDRSYASTLHKTCYSLRGWYVTLNNLLFGFVGRESQQMDVHEDSLMTHVICYQLIKSSLPFIYLCLKISSVI